MAQTAAKRRFDSGDSIRHTPAANVAAGDVVSVFGGVPTIAPSAIVATVEGALDCAGIFDVPKTDDVFVVGDYVFWNAAATDVGANTGGAENVGSEIMGLCLANAANTATHVRTRLLPAAGMARHPVTAVTAAGANIATAAALSEGENLVTASDNATGVQLPSCVDGKRVVVINFVTDKTLKVYPPEGKQVNLAGANNSIAQAANTRIEYVSEGANAYYGS